MKWTVLFPLIFVAACHKKANSPAIQENSAEIHSDTKKISSNVQESVGSAQYRPQKPSKIIREAVYFSASLEREALKLLVKDNSFQKNTLFSVLSYILETQAGVKKSTPLGLDCGKFELQFLKDQIYVQKACQRPFREVVRISTLSPDKDFEFLFKSSEWGRVLGLSAALTGSDIKCRVGIVDQKLSLLNCDNWFFQVSEDQMSSTVIKTTEFLFQRKAEKQFVIKGGYFKELIQNRKIDIVVPLEGKIKIIEKELKVIDEFADQKNGVIHEKKDPIEIKPIEEQGKTEEEIRAAKEGRPVEGLPEDQKEVQPEDQNEVNSGQEAAQQTGQEGQPPVTESAEELPQPVPAPRSRGR